MPMFKHGNFMTGSSDNSMYNNNIMKHQATCGMSQCKGCDLDLKSYYMRSSGSTCPCTGDNDAYTNWYLNREKYPMPNPYPSCGMPQRRRRRR